MLSKGPDRLSESPMCDSDGWLAHIGDQFCDFWHVWDSLDGADYLQKIELVIGVDLVHTECIFHLRSSLFRVRIVSYLYVDSQICRKY